MKFDLAQLTFIETEQSRHKLAVAASDGNLTWGELEAEVDKLVCRLQSLQIPKGHPIIIYGHKEKLFIVAMVACMCLKLPYVPIDTIFPLERLKKIRNILNSSVIIRCETGALETYSVKNLVSYEREFDPIIYIMFTSGSTGKPKGVQITKKAILSYVNWIKQVFPFNSQDCFFNQIPFNFDLSTYEVFSFLTYGASIVTFSRTIINEPDHFISRLAQYSCTVWNSTPSFLSLTFLNGQFNSHTLFSLKKFFLAGEPLTYKVANRLFKKFNGSRLYNSYGPTEACNTSTLVEITAEILRKYSSNLPVGFPKYSTQIHLANTVVENGREIGEIELIGDNVSIGYFANEKLNREKFTLKSGKRCFKTGDYGYFEKDMLFFVGRKDDLIKLHGYRIEIGEIDKAIEEHELVEQSVTVPFTRGIEVAKLVSFIKLNNPEMDTHVVDNINHQLSEKLPYYMVPSGIIVCDDYPYNANHKIDKKALIETYSIFKKINS